MVLALLLTLVICYFVLKNPHYHLINWDVFGYYLYLPQTIIHGDPGISDFSTVQSAIDIYHPAPSFYHGGVSPTGSIVIQYTMGMAIIYLPFFLIAHVWAWLGDYPMDGYSFPYETMMLVGSLTYILAGIWLFRKLCLRFFSDKITALLILFIGFGTNYFFLNTEMLGMSHQYMFVWFCVLLLLTESYFRVPSTGKVMAMGAVLGFMTLSRPTELVAGIFILCWPVRNVRALKERIRYFFVTNRKHTMLFFVSLLFVFFPQLLYWKIYGGSWFYHSYQNPGEGFEFLSPNTWNFLFSFRKGWFIYTPMMFAAVFGILVLYKHRRDLFWPVTLFIVCNVYVLSSWSNWWYAASFGQRAVIDSYPVMALSLGFLLIWISRQRKWLIVVFSSLFSFFVFLNLFQHWQMVSCILDTSRMTWPYYKAAFMRTTVPPNANDLLLIDRMKALSPEVLTDTTKYTGKDLLLQDCEQPEERSGGYYSDSLVYNGKWSYIIVDQDAHAPGMSIPFDEFCQDDHAWLRISMMVYLTDSVQKIHPIPMATFENQNHIAYKWKGVVLRDEMPDFPIGKWVKVEFDYLTPEVRTINDKFSVSLWKAGEGIMAIDNIKVRVYNLKQ